MKQSMNEGVIYLLIVRGKKKILWSECLACDGIKFYTKAEYFRHLSKHEHLLSLLLLNFPEYSELYELTKDQKILEAVQAVQIPTGNTSISAYPKTAKKVLHTLRSSLMKTLKQKEAFTQLAQLVLDDYKVRLIADPDASCHRFVSNHNSIDDHNQFDNNHLTTNTDNFVYARINSAGAIPLMPYSGQITDNRSRDVEIFSRVRDIESPLIPCLQSPEADFNPIWCGDTTDCRKNFVHHHKGTLVWRTVVETSRIIRESERNHAENWSGKNYSSTPWVDARCSSLAYKSNRVGASSLSTGNFGTILNRLSYNNEISKEQNYEQALYNSRLAHLAPYQPALVSAFQENRQLLIQTNQNPYCKDHTRPFPEHEFVSGLEGTQQFCNYGQVNKRVEAFSSGEHETLCHKLESKHSLHPFQSRELFYNSREHDLPCLMHENSKSPRPSMYPVSSIKQRLSYKPMDKNSECEKGIIFAGEKCQITVAAKNIQLETQVNRHFPKNTKPNNKDGQCMKFPKNEDQIKNNRLRRKELVKRRLSQNSEMAVRNNSCSIPTLSGQKAISRGINPCPSSQKASLPSQSASSLNLTQLPGVCKPKDRSTFSLIKNSFSCASSVSSLNQTTAPEHGPHHVCPSSIISSLQPSTQTTCSDKSHQTMFNNNITVKNPQTNFPREESSTKKILIGSNTLKKANLTCVQKRLSSIYSNAIDGCTNNNPSAIELSDHSNKHSGNNSSASPGTLKPFVLDPTTGNLTSVAEDKLLISHELPALQCSEDNDWKLRKRLENLSGSSSFAESPGQSKSEKCHVAVLCNQATATVLTPLMRDMNSEFILTDNLKAANCKEFMSSLALKRDKLGSVTWLVMLGVEVISDVCMQSCRCNSKCPEMVRAIHFSEDLRAEKINFIDKLKAEFDILFKNCTVYFMYDRPIVACPNDWSWSTIHRLNQKVSNMHVVARDEVLSLKESFTSFLRHYYDQFLSVNAREPSFENMLDAMQLRTCVDPSENLVSFEVIWLRRVSELLRETWSPSNSVKSGLVFETAEKRDAPKENLVTSALGYIKKEPDDPTNVNASDSITNLLNNSPATSLSNSEHSSIKDPKDEELTLRHLNSTSIKFETFSSDTTFSERPLFELQSDDNLLDSKAVNKVALPIKDEIDFKSDIHDIILFSTKQNANCPSPNDSITERTTLLSPAISGKSSQGESNIKTRTTSALSGTKSACEESVLCLNEVTSVDTTSLAMTCCDKIVQNINPNSAVNSDDFNTSNQRSESVEKLEAEATTLSDSKQNSVDEIGKASHALLDPPANGPDSNDPCTNNDDESSDADFSYEFSPDVSKSDFDVRCYSTSHSALLLGHQSSSDDSDFLYDIPQQTETAALETEKNSGKRKMNEEEHSGGKYLQESCKVIGEQKEKQKKDKVTISHAIRAQDNSSRKSSTSSKSKTNELREKPECSKHIRLEKARADKDGAKESEESLNKVDDSSSPSDSVAPYGCSLAQSPSNDIPLAPSSILPSPRRRKRNDSSFPSPRRRKRNDSSFPSPRRRKRNRNFVIVFGFPTKYLTELRQVLKFCKARQCSVVEHQVTKVEGIKGIFSSLEDSKRCYRVLKDTRLRSTKPFKQVGKGTGRPQENRHILTLSLLHHPKLPHSQDVPPEDALKDLKLFWKLQKYFDTSFGDRLRLLKNITADVSTRRTELNELPTDDAELSKPFNRHGRRPSRAALYWESSDYRRKRDMASTSKDVVNFANPDLAALPAYNSTRCTEVFSAAPTLLSATPTTINALTEPCPIITNQSSGVASNRVSAAPLMNKISSFEILNSTVNRLNVGNDTDTTSVTTSTSAVGLSTIHASKSCNSISVPSTTSTSCNETLVQPSTPANKMRTPSSSSTYTFMNPRNSVSVEATSKSTYSAAISKHSCIKNSEIHVNDSQFISSDVVNSLSPNLMKKLKLVLEYSAVACTASQTAHAIDSDNRGTSTIAANSMNSTLACTPKGTNSSNFVNTFNEVRENSTISNTRHKVSFEIHGRSPIGRSPIETSSMPVMISGSYGHSMQDLDASFQTETVCSASSDGPMINSKTQFLPQNSSPNATIMLHTSQSSKSSTAEIDFRSSNSSTSFTSLGPSNESSSEDKFDNRNVDNIRSHPSPDEHLTWYRVTEISPYIPRSLLTRLLEACGTLLTDNSFCNALKVGLKTVADEVLLLKISKMTWLGPLMRLNRLRSVFPVPLIESEQFTNSERGVVDAAFAACSNDVREYLTIVVQAEYDLVQFKTRKCKVQNCASEVCLDYHSAKDKRRNVLHHPYSPQLCNHKKFAATGNCQYGNECAYSQNRFESLYHPYYFKYMCKPNCNEKNFCPRRHPGTAIHNLTSGAMRMYCPGYSNTLFFLSAVVRLCSSKAESIFFPGKCLQTFPKPLQNRHGGAVRAIFVVDKDFFQEAFLESVADLAKCYEVVISELLVAPDSSAQSTILRPVNKNSHVSDTNIVVGRAGLVADWLHCHPARVASLQYLIIEYRNEETLIQSILSKLDVCTSRDRIKTVVVGENNSLDYRKNISALLGQYLESAFIDDRVVKRFLAALRTTNSAPAKDIPNTSFKQQSAGSPQPTSKTSSSSDQSASCSSGPEVQRLTTSAGRIESVKEQQPNSKTGTVGIGFSADASACTPVPRMTSTSIVEDPQTEPRSESISTSVPNTFLESNKLDETSKFEYSRPDNHMRSSSISSRFSYAFLRKNLDVGYGSCDDVSAKKCSSVAEPKNMPPSCNKSGNDEENENFLNVLSSEEAIVKHTTTTSRNSPCLSSSTQTKLGTSKNTSVSCSQNLSALDLSFVSSPLTEQNLPVSSALECFRDNENRTGTDNSGNRNGSKTETPCVATTSRSAFEVLNKEVDCARTNKVGEKSKVLVGSEVCQESVSCRPVTYLKSAESLVNVGDLFRKNAIIETIVISDDDSTSENEIRQTRTKFARNLSFDDWECKTLVKSLNVIPGKLLIENEDMLLKTITVNSTFLEPHLNRDEDNDIHAKILRVLENPSLTASPVTLEERVTSSEGSTVSSTPKMIGDEGGIEESDVEVINNCPTSALTDFFENRGRITNPNTLMKIARSNAEIQISSKVEPKDGNDPSTSPDSENSSGHVAILSTEKQKTLKLVQVPHDAFPAAESTPKATLTESISSADMNIQTVSSIVSQKSIISTAAVEPDNNVTSPLDVVKQTLTALPGEKLERGSTTERGRSPQITSTSYTDSQNSILTSTIREKILKSTAFQTLLAKYGDPSLSGNNSSITSSAGISVNNASRLSNPDVTNENHAPVRSEASEKTKAETSCHSPVKTNHLNAIASNNLLSSSKFCGSNANSTANLSREDATEASHIDNSRQHSSTIITQSHSYGNCNTAQEISSKNRQIYVTPSPYSNMAEDSCHKLDASSKSSKLPPKSCHSQSLLQKRPSIKQHELQVNKPDKLEKSKALGENSVSDQTVSSSKIAGTECSSVQSAQSKEIISHKESVKSNSHHVSNVKKGSPTLNSFSAAGIDSMQRPRKNPETLPGYTSCRQDHSPCTGSTISYPAPSQNDRLCSLTEVAAKELLERTNSFTKSPRETTTSKKTTQNHYDSTSPHGKSAIVAASTHEKVISIKDSASKTALTKSVSHRKSLPDSSMLKKVSSGLETGSLFDLNLSKELGGKKELVSFKSSTKITGNSELSSKIRDCTQKTDKESEATSKTPKKLLFASKLASSTKIRSPSNHPSPPVFISPKKPLISHPATYQKNSLMKSRCDVKSALSIESSDPVNNANMSGGSQKKITEVSSSVCNTIADKQEFREILSKKQVSPITHYPAHADRRNKSTCVSPSASIPHKQSSSQKVNKENSSVKRSGNRLVPRMKEETSKSSLEKNRVVESFCNSEEPSNSQKPKKKARMQDEQDTSEISRGGRIGATAPATIGKCYPNSLNHSRQKEGKKTLGSPGAVCKIGSSSKVASDTCKTSKHDSGAKLAKESHKEKHLKPDKKHRSTKCETKETTDIPIAFDHHSINIEKKSQNVKCSVGNKRKTSDELLGSNASQQLQNKRKECEFPPDNKMGHTVKKFKTSNDKSNAPKNSSTSPVRSHDVATTPRHSSKIFEKNPKKSVVTSKHESKRSGHKVSGFKDLRKDDTPTKILSESKIKDSAGKSSKPCKASEKSDRKLLEQSKVLSGESNLRKNASVKNKIPEVISGKESEVETVQQAHNKTLEENFKDTKKSSEKNSRKLSDRASTFCENGKPSVDTDPDEFDIAIPEKSNIKIVDPEVTNDTTTLPSSADEIVESFKEAFEQTKEFLVYNSLGRILDDVRDCYIQALQHYHKNNDEIALMKCVKRIGDTSGYEIARTAENQFVDYLKSPEKSPDYHNAHRSYGTRQDPTMPWEAFWRLKMELWREERILHLKLMWRSCFRR
ncbi:uncharacterized protein LOC108679098 [Hyalella azteca]|uniref:Uncharacterized protein LOC108679098 n=1 Tax=Hyalella azteca TaxID=294128 RepID=A0A979FVL9_HYAAZ|nr:uncharacterized protein LOC108679098 [Hyalella azteca]